MQLSQLIPRTLQWFFTIVIMGLSGNIIAIANGYAPAVVNYTMFVSVFSMLSLFYLTLIAFKEGFVGLPIIPVVLDALNTLFTLTAGIALAAELGVHSCTNTSYINSNKVTGGSTRRCREGQASCAFLWFLFATYVATLALSAMGVSGSSVNLRPSKIRRGGPAMSQV